MPREPLPTVAPSAFRRDADIASPLATTEQVSGLWRVPYRVNTRPGVRWVAGGHHDEPRIAGSWDVGVAELALVKPVWQHELRRDGRIVSTQTPRHRRDDLGEDEESCPPGFAFGDAPAGMGEPDAAVRVKAAAGSSRLMRFHTLAPLPRAKADMVSTPRRLSGGVVGAGFVAAQQLHYDLDGDGVPDLVVWEGTGQSDNELHAPRREEPYFRVIAVNIAGNWQLLYTDEYVYGCGC